MRRDGSQVVGLPSRRVPGDLSPLAGYFADQSHSPHKITKARQVAIPPSGCVVPSASKSATTSTSGSATTTRM